MKFFQVKMKLKELGHIFGPLHIFIFFHFSILKDFINYFDL